MTFNQKVSAYTLNFLSEKDLPGIGLAGLEEGYDSPSLRILAGYNHDDNTFQIYDTYKQSLSELNYILADRKTLLINVLTYYAKQIVIGTIDSYAGFEFINDLVGKTEFNYPDIYLEECYVDYITIWEVQSNGLQLHTGSGMSKEQYLDLTKKKLISHIQSWLEQTGCT